MWRKLWINIKLSIPPDFNIKFNKNDFFKSFTDVNNILNIKIMKCYNTVLKIKSLKNNYGFYIIGFIVLLYFITLLIFTTVSFNELKKDTNKIIFALKVNEFPIQNKQIKQIKQTIKKPIEINNRIRSLIEKDQTKKLGKNIII